ncbi:MAG TPA: hypothetical protein VEQ84_00985 [Vicinamibacteria bacterium]|nr:hypothetical protein [Vicinamibacteria bacterium]
MRQSGWISGALVSLAACTAATTGLIGCAAATIELIGCGGGSGTSRPSETAIQVGGSYDIRKSVVEETCGLSRPGDVFNNPGTVQHSPGATEFVLSDHGSRDLPGTLRRDGGFDLRPMSSLVMDTIPATDTFEGGRFTATGFALRSTTVLQRSPVTGAADGPCRVVTTWDATKQGAPNVIP